MTRLMLIAIAGLAGCAEPLHLSYDFGRSYDTAFTSQADLTRPSVASEQYVLYGLEGVKIRLLVTEETTKQESGEITSE